MPEPFKNLFNPQMIALMAHHFQRVWKDFNSTEFIGRASLDLETLELKQRADQIKSALEGCLPLAFKDVAPIMLDALHPQDDIELSGTDMDERGIRGWAILPMTQYVGEHGTGDFDLGMTVQKELTKRFSSEFGIRFFIISDQDRALETLSSWTTDPNFHVRRLVSEGTRPRLPWAMRLQAFIENPAPLIPILDQLKDDETEYVRRSVANNLNDIAKDHPDRVAKIAKNWIAGATPQRKQLVRHACRTLIKNGHAATLSALGYQKPKITLATFEISTPTVVFGEALQFSIRMTSEAPSDQDLIVDYVIHHRKANGKTSPKVFKWKTITLKPGGHHEAIRKHAIKPITTRRYYPGTHRVEIVINGENFGGADFELAMPVA